MDNNKQTAFEFSMGSLVWATGVIESIDDPKKLGRVKVRLMGFHTDNKDDIPSDDLFWANVIMPCNSASMNGVGQSPTGMLNGTWVVGFFRDGQYKQDFLIWGSIGGIPEKVSNPDLGFNDPTGEFPREDFVGEPDTNRLARGEKISDTIVRDKQNTQEIDIDKCFGGKFSEPNVPNSRKYPTTHTKETESGHIEEYDDTPGNERFHRYHRTGTFVEVHPDGKEVRHVVNDKYEVVMGDDTLHITGDVNITVDGDAHILVKKDCNLEVQEDFNHWVHGDYNLLVGGNYHFKCNNHVFMNSSGGSRSFDINSSRAKKVSF